MTCQLYFSEKINDSSDSDEYNNNSEITQDVLEALKRLYVIDRCSECSVIIQFYHYGCAMAEHDGDKCLNCE